MDAYIQYITSECPETKDCLTLKKSQRPAVRLPGAYMCCIPYHIILLCQEEVMPCKRILSYDGDGVENQNKIKRLANHLLRLTTID